MLLSFVCEIRQLVAWQQSVQRGKCRAEAVKLRVSQFALKRCDVFYEVSSGSVVVECGSLRKRIRLEMLLESGGSNGNGKKAAKTSGRKKPSAAEERGEPVPVTLKTQITEVGTLELWCVERGGDRSWKLEWNVREGGGEE